MELSTSSYDECSSRCSKDLGCTHFQWAKSTCSFFQGDIDKEEAVFDDDKSSVCGIPQENYPTKEGKNQNNLGLHTLNILGSKGLICICIYAVMASSNNNM